MSTFLIDEDRALKSKLQGITVIDQKSRQNGSPRSVGVWFGQPDQEIIEQAYPYITIDLLGVSEDPTRAMRGIVSPEYLRPSGLDPATNSFAVDMPIPVTLDYQITSYARHPQHDRQIISQLLHNHTLLRFGYLEIPYTNADGDDAVVFRRMDVTGIAKRDVTEQAKRLFVNAITVRISSEVVQTVLDNLYKVRQINVTDVLDLTIKGRQGAPVFEGVGSITISE